MRWRARFIARPLMFPVAVLGLSVVTACIASDPKRWLSGMTNGGGNLGDYYVGSNAVLAKVCSSCSSIHCLIIYNCLDRTDEALSTCRTQRSIAAKDASGLSVFIGIGDAVPCIKSIVGLSRRSGPRGS